MNTRHARVTLEQVPGRGKRRTTENGLTGLEQDAGDEEDEAQHGAQQHHALEEAVAVLRLDAAIDEESDEQQHGTQARHRDG